MVEVDPAVGGDFNGRPANEIFLGFFARRNHGIYIIGELRQSFSQLVARIALPSKGAWASKKSIHPVSLLAAGCCWSNQLSHANMGA